MNFGGIHALDGLNVKIRRETVTAVIGPNGAGKTTLFNVLSGFVRPDQGTVHFEGADVTRLPAHRRARLGIVRTFQISRALARLTVEENLLLAPTSNPEERWWAPFLLPPRVRVREEQLRTRAKATLDFFELAGVANDLAGSLSGGQKKLLELARALMTDPRVVLLDEPVAGVNPTLARKILEKIHHLRKERGITFVVVEHDLATVFQNCDPIIVLAQGKVLEEGDAAMIRAKKSVIDAYLGDAA